MRTKSIILMMAFFVIFGCGNFKSNLQENSNNHDYGFIANYVARQKKVIIRKKIIKEKKPRKKLSETDILFRVAPELLRKHVVDVKIESKNNKYMVNYKIKYKVKKGDTIKKLKRFGFRSSDLVNHLHTVKLKNIKQFKNAKTGYKYLLAGDVIQLESSYTFYQSSDNI